MGVSWERGVGEVCRPRRGKSRRTILPLQPSLWGRTLLLLGGGLEGWDGANGKSQKTRWHSVLHEVAAGSSFSWIPLSDIQMGMLCLRKVQARRSRFLCGVLLFNPAWPSLVPSSGSHDTSSSVLWVAGAVDASCCLCLGMCAVSKATTLQRRPLEKPGKVSYKNIGWYFCDQ